MFSLNKTKLVLSILKKFSNIWTIFGAHYMVNILIVHFAYIIGKEQHSKSNQLQNAFNAIDAPFLWSALVHGSKIF